jgi:hypothetical protein
MEFFSPWSPEDGSPISFTQNQNEALNKIFKWASAVALPSAAYSVEFVETDSDEPAAGTSPEARSKLRTYGLTAEQMSRESNMRAALMQDWSWTF